MKKDDDELDGREQDEPVNDSEQEIAEYGADDDIDTVDAIDGDPQAHSSYQVPKIRNCS